MDASRIARLAMDLVAPDTLDGLMGVIAGVVAGVEGFETRMVKGTSSCITIVEWNNQDLSPSDLYLETWTSIPSTGGKNPLALARIRARDLTGAPAAKAGIVATVLAVILDTSERGDIPSFPRAGFYTWRPGNELLTSVIRVPGVYRGHVLAEPTGMVPCTVEKAHGHLRATIDPGPGTAPGTGHIAASVAGLLRRELEPRHDLYDLHGNPALAAKFLVGATVASVELVDPPGTVDIRYTCPPLDKTFPAAVEQAVHHAVNVGAPGARARVEVLDAGQGAIAPPRSWLLDRLTGWHVARTGEQPYLDWHAGSTMAPMIPPDTPWIVTGPGTVEGGGRVTLDELAAYGDLLERLSTVPPACREGG